MNHVAVAIAVTYAAVTRAAVTVAIPRRSQHRHRAEQDPEGQEQDLHATSLLDEASPFQNETIWFECRQAASSFLNQLLPYADLLTLVNVSARTCTMIEHCRC